MLTARYLDTLSVKGPRAGCIDDIYRTVDGRYVQYVKPGVWSDIHTGEMVVAPIKGKMRPRALRLPRPT